MKHKLLFIILFISCFKIFSQELFSPITSETFGLNNHTNRDVSYFSHVDSNENTIIIATTEKDSTFTDVLVTKIDANFNLVWQKRVSQDTNLSYDIPVKSFVNTNNETYVIGRSSFNQSLSNGLIFIIKLNENGDIIYNITIGNTDASDYRDYSYMDVDLNNDGTLSLVYNPIEFDSENLDDFVFLKVNNNGDIINSFTQEIPENGIIGKINNETFYFLTQELNDIDYSLTYNFHKIQDENNQDSFQITNSEFLSYYNNSGLSDQVKLTIDNNSNFYIAFNNIYDNDAIGKINLTKIGSNNSVSYSTTTNISNNYTLIDTFINNENENISVVNKNDDNTLQYLFVDANNTIQSLSNVENTVATGFKKNTDGSFFITTSNSNIRLFSNTLTELTVFNTSDSFELIDFSKINNETINVIGTSYSKMFPTSDYYTQLDIEVEKINSTEVINNYSYSGIGTSKAFQQRVIIDNDNNYLVLVTEKMGPEYLGIGGVNPPLNKRIIKYDSDLEMLWEVEIPNNIFNLVNHGGKDIDFFFDADNNLFLNLPRAGNNYGLGYSLYKVTPNGNIEYVNDTYVAKMFHANENYILMAEDYFMYDDTSKIYILDKVTGNLINEIEVGHEEFLEIFTIGEDYYFYTYESITNNTPDFIYLYKNGVKQFTRSLDNNYGIFPYEIDENGTLFFSTRNPPERRLNKLDIYNNYSYYLTADQIYGLKKFSNGNMFLFLNNDNTLVLDDDLNLLSNGDDLDVSNIYLMTHGDYILLGTYYDNNIRIIDNNGSVVKHLYLQSGYLHNWYSKFDNQGDVIMVGQNGNRISTFNEYGWARGFIHKFGTIENLLTIEEFETSNYNIVTLYPNPTSSILNIKISNKIVETVILFDTAGKQLKIFNNSIIDLEDFKSGIYFIKIITASKDIINKKIIKN
ncbi:T9SS type A sorting domain-containing protein [Winogradskyella sp. SM1960]|uniref:T9SS type A sorting domain-containing protein n=1 Tax=Winogradskyella sp. SM1960 TaxID=2865955 RepID=UPI001CD1CEE8|nr:T9SS type A sorting domain-containing protein [Winogradskyella sp. SM1960]